MSLAAIPWVRLIVVALATGTGVGGQGGVVISHPNSALARRGPASLILGLLLMHGMRIGWGSASPMMDFGFVAGKIVGCILAILAGVLLFVEKAHQPPTELSAKAEEVPAAEPKARLGRPIIASTNQIAPFCRPALQLIASTNQIAPFCRPGVQSIASTNQIAPFCRPRGQAIASTNPIAPFCRPGRQAIASTNPIAPFFRPREDRSSRRPITSLHSSDHRRTWLRPEMDSMAPGLVHSGLSMSSI